MPDAPPWKLSAIHYPQGAWNLGALIGANALVFEGKPSLQLHVGDQQVIADFIMSIAFSEREGADVVADVSVRVVAQYTTTLTREELRAQGHHRAIGEHAVDRLPGLALAEVMRVMTSAGVTTPIDLPINVFGSVFSFDDASTEELPPGEATNP
ncbi:hypothetical protein [Deinococcus rufus]|uniref:Uncharacterized protein n=1 Tax=Deinococcus rufus TaxID=2136097 RepID=A0ABV7ZBN1_9DEIO